MSDQPTPEPAELLARYAEADSLLRAARERTVQDHIAMQRMAAEITSLREQLTQVQDSYEQLARLVETNPGPAATND